ncbi:hypothetical protein PV729_34390, partial [Streptomyces europaeiscabiei]
SQRPRCVLLQRNLDHRKVSADGVSTYLALIFGTLLSSQGTDASFVITQDFLGFSPGASLRCSKLYQRFSDPLTTILQTCRK